MESLMKTMPVWPGLDMSKRTKKMAAESKRGSKKMVTVMASRIIEDRLLKVRLGK